MKTYRIILRRSLTGTELYKIQVLRFGIFWMNVTEMYGDSPDPVIRPPRIEWHDSIYAARTSIGRRQAGPPHLYDIVVETVQVI